MSESNARKTKKLYASQLENELFTLQTELDNLSFKLHQAKFNELKRISLHRLKQIREDIQYIRHRVWRINENIKVISRVEFHDEVSHENGKEIIVWRQHV